MSRFTGFLVVLVLCLFKIQESTSACISVKEPCVYQSCACPSTLAGVVNCAGCACDTCKTCTQSPKTCVSCCACQEGCKCRTKFYFPETEYPDTILDLDPFFFANCWGY